MTAPTVNLSYFTIGAALSILLRYQTYPST